MKYQSDDPRQIDLEEAIALRGGKPYTPGPRQAIAFGEDSSPLSVSQRRTEEDYRSLKDVLDRAYHQAAFGKGRERHGTSEPFDDQPIMRIAAAHGIGFLTGQAAKKIEEANGMLARGSPEMAQREFLGAIVYIAAAHIHIAQKNLVMDKDGVDLSRTTE